MESNNANTPAQGTNLVDLYSSYVDKSAASYRAIKNSFEPLIRDGSAEAKQQAIKVIDNAFVDNVLYTAQLVKSTLESGGSGSRSSGDAAGNDSVSIPENLAAMFLREAIAGSSGRGHGGPFRGPPNASGATISAATTSDGEVIDLTREDTESGSRRNTEEESESEAENVNNNNNNNNNINHESEDDEETDEEMATENGNVESNANNQLREEESDSDEDDDEENVEESSEEEDSDNNSPITNQPTEKAKETEQPPALKASSPKSPPQTAAAISPATIRKSPIVTVVNSANSVITTTTPKRPNSATTSNSLAVSEGGDANGSATKRRRADSGIYACPVPECPNSYSNPSSLKNHMVKHSNEMWRCTWAQCTWSSKYKYSAVSHVRKTHMGNAEPQKGAAMGYLQLVKIG